MNVRIITVGKPKLVYAQAGWSEYFDRLGHYHQLSTTHVPDRHNDAQHILAATDKTYRVGLVIAGQQLSSLQLAEFLNKRALDSKAVSFVIGGPDGLPPEVLDKMDYKWSLGKLTFPHDLGMIILLEALYRASTINAGHPYHR